MEHSKLPWVVFDDGPYKSIRVKNDEMTFPPQIGDLAASKHWFDEETMEANAAFIVLAVNSHEALMEALKEALDIVMHGAVDSSHLMRVEDMARAAIKAGEVKG